MALMYQEGFLDIRKGPFPVKINKYLVQSIFLPSW